MDSERPAAALEDAVSDLGSRWEILETGISVKLYPSCAATHPPLDAVLSLVRQHRFAADDVKSIEFEVDSMTPRLLIYDRPATDLEAKFSLPFCAAAAIIFGHPAIDTFEAKRIQDPRVQAAASAHLHASEHFIRLVRSAFASTRNRSPAGRTKIRSQVRRGARISRQVERGRDRGEIFGVCQAVSLGRFGCRLTCGAPKY